MTAPNGCTSECSTEVESDVDKPSCGAENDGPINCDRSVVTLTGSSDVGVTYSWEAPDGEIRNGQMVMVNEPGTYTLTVTASNGCTSTCSTTVVLDNNMQACNAIVEGLLTCDENSTVTLKAGSVDDSGTTFMWKGISPSNVGFMANGFSAETNLPGEYELKLTASNGCISRCTTFVDLPFCDPIIIEIPKDISVPCDVTIPVLTDVLANEEDYSGHVVTFTDSIAEYVDPCDYKIYRKYCVTAYIGTTEFKECETQIITIIDPLDFGLPCEIESMNVYPNPFNASLNIDVLVVDNTDVNAFILNHSGTIIMAQTKASIGDELNFTFNTSGLAAGNYFAKVSTSCDVSDLRILKIE